MALYHFLSGNLEKCFSLLNGIYQSDHANMSAFHNMLLTEWYRDHNMEKMRQKYEDFVNSQGPSQGNKHYCTYILNLCVIYFYCEEFEISKEILISHLNFFHNCESKHLILRYIYLLTEILFTLAERDYTCLVDFSSHWNPVLELWTNSLSSVSPLVAFRLHIINSRYHFTICQYKTAKKELKLAMELYHHQLKIMKHGDFVKSQCLYHFNFLSIANIETILNPENELAKEGCVVHFLKAYHELLRDNPIKSLKLLQSEPFGHLLNPYSSISPHLSSNMETEYYNNLGCVNFGLGNFCSSYLYLKKSLQLKNVPHKLHSVLYNCGLVLMRMCEPRVAFDYFQASSELLQHKHWLVYLRLAECCLLIFHEAQRVNSDDSEVLVAQRRYQVNHRFGRSLHKDKNKVFLIYSIKYLEIASQIIQNHRLSWSEGKRQTCEPDIEEQSNERMLTSAENVVLLNMVYAHMALDDWVRALRVAQRLLHNLSLEDNLRNQALQYAAECLCHLGKFSEATTLLKDSSSQIEKLYNFEVIKLFQGECAAPESYFRLVSERDPKCLATKNNLIFIYLRLQLRDRARTILSKS